jgi:hypothetical protein
MENIIKQYILFIFYLEAFFKILNVESNSRDTSYFKDLLKLFDTIIWQWFINEVKCFKF